MLLPRELAWPPAVVGPVPARSWPAVGLLLACCWLVVGPVLARCWPGVGGVGPLLARCWSGVGLVLAFL